MLTYWKLVTAYLFLTNLYLGCEETELMFGSADEDSMIKGEIMSKDVKLNQDIIAAMNKNINHHQVRLHSNSDMFCW